MSDKKDIDLALLGATGFTGRQLVRALRRQAAGSGLRVLLAGRRADLLSELAGSDFETQVCDIDDESAPADAPAQSQQLLASEDLIASFGPVYVREKPAPAPMGAKEAHPADTQARRALDVLRQALTAELGLFPDQVWELEATTSNDINAELGGHIDHVSLVIQRGQWRDTDEVCEALLRAVHTLRTHFDLMPGEA